MYVRYVVLTRSFQQVVTESLTTTGEIVASLYVLTAHVTAVCVYHAELKGYLLYLLT